jgi:GNAT superfamily N-acetyltransferase
MLEASPLAAATHQPAGPPARPETPPPEAVAVVRPAVEADAAAIIEFQLRMAWEAERLRLDPAVVERGVRAVLADPAKGKYLVVERQGRAVASLLMGFEWSDWRAGSMLWMLSVYVVPEERGRGVSRMIFDHVKNMVEAAPDLLGLRGYTDQRNVEAQHVWERRGMTRDHYYFHEWLKPQPEPLAEPGNSLRS